MCQSNPPKRHPQSSLECSGSRCPLCLVYCVESIVLEFSIVSYTFLLFSYVYIECKWADLFPSPYSPTCRSVVAFPLLNTVLIPPLAVPLELCHSRALSDASFNIKHIHVKYHYVRELVANNELCIKRISSSDNTADILTKPLGRSDFLCLRLQLGLRFPPGSVVTS